MPQPDGTEILIAQARDAARAACPTGKPPVHTYYLFGFVCERGHVPTTELALTCITKHLHEYRLCGVCGEVARLAIVAKSITAAWDAPERSKPEATYALSLELAKNPDFTPTYKWEWRFDSHNAMTAFALVRHLAYAPSAMGTESAPTTVNA